MTDNGISGSSPFRRQPPALPPLADASTDMAPPSSLNGLLPDLDEKSDTGEDLFIIPINKEIAPDFTLIGSDDTIRHIEEVLSQGGKRRNVLLYGDNGAGKTSIIQGLVQRKNRSDLSTHMYKRTFYRLNTSKLLHTDDVGEINKQFDHVIGELGQYDVLVIENVYTVLTYLKAKGANSVVIGFLESLSRRKIQSIITCNSRERTQLIADVPEVHEYFVSEKINEPDNDELLNILRGVRKSYEERYSVLVPDDTLRSARDLTQKYRNGFEEWAQPGRAFVLLDRAIAQFSVRMNSKPEELTNLENEVDNAKNEIQSLCSSFSEADSARCETLTTRLKEIEPKVKEMRSQWEMTTAPIRALQMKKGEFEKRHHAYTNRRHELKDLRDDVPKMVAQNRDTETIDNEIIGLGKSIIIAESEIAKINAEMAKINLSDQRDHRVTVDDIAQTFSELSGIPAKQLTANERERVLKMEEILGERVFGQDEAKKAIATAVRRSKANLSDDEGTPKGNFLFLGPSGCGKTELGKALAEFETGSDGNAIEIDMSEYMEQHSVSRLIGAPPGYAGYDAGGQLTNAVRLHPKSVIIFDEVEKAHTDVFKLLLQVMGAGRLTDGRGDTVDFRETYNIFTSNLGTAYFLDENLSYEQAAALAMKKVEEKFAPEFRGRLDGIICFRRLDLSMMVKVAHKRFNKINKGLERPRLHLIVSDDDTQRFCTAYQDTQFGARSILKALKITLEEDLATAILSRTNSGGGTFTATFGDKTFNPLTFEPLLIPVKHHAA